jgi:hypothetical protein
MSETQDCAYVNEHPTIFGTTYSYCSAPGDEAVGGNWFCAFHATGVRYEEEVHP